MKNFLCLILFGCCYFLTSAQSDQIFFENWTTDDGTSDHDTNVAPEVNWTKDSNGTSVGGGNLEFSNTNTDACWETSSAIDVSASGIVTISMTVTESGDLEGECSVGQTDECNSAGSDPQGHLNRDFLDIEYSFDGSSWTKFSPAFICIVSCPSQTPNTCNANSEGHVYFGDCNFGTVDDADFSSDNFDESINTIGQSELYLRVCANVNEGSADFSIGELEVLGVSPLPVILTSFEAEDRDGTVELSWATSAEINNSHFEIQKSTDGRAFLTVGTVKGHGTTRLPQIYSYSMPINQNENHYFRLKQVDFDGKFEYSKVVAIGSEATAKDQIKILVDNGQLSAIGIENNTTYIIRDQQGRIHSQGSISEYDFVNVSSLSRGVYFISILNDRKIETHRFFH